jgi:NAD(P)-dependent dehydrogenase (short-subunit alcohol dehydrogenase family)
MDEPAPAVANGGSDRLTGQTAMVTGAGRGLGRAIAVNLAREGAAVAVIARTAAEVDETVGLIVGSGGRATGVAVDVTDGRAVGRAVAEVRASLGPVTLLVNNAGVITPLGPAWEVSADEWWRLLETNVRGPLNGAHAVLPAMTAARSGRIVNIVSGVGLRSVENLSAYATSKAALIRLTEALAIDAAASGVAVFAVDPGYLSTAMTEYLAYSDAGRQWTPQAASLFGTPDHVPVERAAGLVATLATGVADRLTGRFLTVWDDVDELVGRADEIVAQDLYAMRLRPERTSPPAQ